MGEYLPSFTSLEFIIKSESYNGTNVSKLLVACQISRSCKLIFIDGLWRIQQITTICRTLLGPYVMDVGL